ncbi:hypothetical protein MBLNU459_g0870t1 [Dothideomycetes sp. NU459]
MRLFLLPVSTRRTLIYCERIQAQVNGAKPSVHDRVVNKANETWTQWEKSDTKWKLRLTEYGNRMFNRIDYREWGLKTLPHTTNRDNLEPIEVLYPNNFLQSARVPSVLQALATERQSLHKKNMLLSVAAMPLTIPVGLLPVIPNVPFLYLAFRAWSHYKALYGSKYLEACLNRNLTKPSPSNTLNELYAAGLMHPSREDSRKAVLPTADESIEIANRFSAQTNGETDVMLLKRWNGKLLAEKFQLPGMEIEIERAVEQVEKEIETAAKLTEESAETEKSTVKQSDRRDQ